MQSPNTLRRLIPRVLLYTLILVACELIMNNLTFVMVLFLYNYELIIHNVYYMYSYSYFSSDRPKKDILTNPTVDEIVLRRTYAKELLDTRTRDKWKAVKNLARTPKQVILADLLHIGEVAEYRKLMLSGTFKLAFFPLAWGTGLYRISRRTIVLVGIISVAILGGVTTLFFNLANNEFLMLADTNFSYISESIFYEFFSLIFLLMYIIFTRVIIVDFILDRRQTQALNEALSSLIVYYDKLQTELEVNETHEKA